MKKRSPVVLCLTIWMCTPLFTRTADKPDTLTAALQTRLLSIQKTVDFPGATLAVVLPGGREISLAVGLSDKEQPIHMKPSDRMFAGSVGKTFLAAAVLQLKKEKKVSLDRKAETFFRDTSWFSRIPNARNITLRMLMTHTSGIPRHIFTEKFRMNLAKDPNRIWEPAELLSYVLDLTPVHPAGKGWSYSDTNYIILGMIFEQLAGNPFYTEVTRRFLRPLGLNSTLPAVNRDLPGLVSGYTGKEPFGLPPKVTESGRYVINPQFEWTGGGFLSNSLDLARWAKALYGGDLLDESDLREMLSPLDYETGAPAETGYGLGVQVWDSPFGPVYGHGGTFPGYQTQMAYLPRHRFSIAMQINSDRSVLPEAKDLYRHFATFYAVVVSHLNPGGGMDKD